MQRIAFCFMLSSFVCVCVCVCARACLYAAAFVDLRKRFEIETPFFFYIAQNDTGHNYTNRITNSKMADKMAASETLYLAVTQPFINM